MLRWVGKQSEWIVFWFGGNGLFHASRGHVRLLFPGMESWKSSREERLEVLVLLFCICIAFADPDSALLVRGWGYKPKSRHATPTMFFLWSGSMELHGISICGWLYYVCNSRIVTLQCDRTHSSPPGGKMKRLICTSTGVQNLVECRRTN